MALIVDEDDVLLQPREVVLLDLEVHSDPLVRDDAGPEVRSAWIRVWLIRRQATERDLDAGQGAPANHERLQAYRASPVGTGADPGSIPRAGAVRTFSLECVGYDDVFAGEHGTGPHRRDSERPIALEGCDANVDLRAS